MPSRLTVVVLSLLLATAVLIFWLGFVILPARVSILCPEGCESKKGYIIICNGPSLTAPPLIRLTNTRVLLLRRNEIRLLERDRFVSLTELEILSLLECRKVTIELGAFNGLTKLAELLVGCNKASKIKPGTFENMMSLKKLVLRYNRIEHLNSDVFSGLVYIKTIDLTATKLQFLHPDTFLGLPKLQYLYLSINPGLQIPTDRNFINSQFLSHLDISNCNVSSVSVETFTNVSVLNGLDLRCNNLWTVDINIVRALPELSKLYLYGNPLQCNSQLKEVWRWCEHRNIRTAYDGLNEVGVSECDTQKEVMGIWWGVVREMAVLSG